ncbi:hypothetical protein P3T76_002127 [Phytophthora citrophthora]|uniref:MULE transposase domain-containing protein n=1 Tax=Phytophthora citrophthora TaxID=4793 RepID=A0AAD9GXZ4_9STRA|nr:hypothetical protein P3T76_002127 [Phytophthora citrophthora]
MTLHSQMLPSLQSARVDPERYPEGIVTTSTATVAPTNLQTAVEGSTRGNTVRESSARDGDTKRYYQGYEHTRVNTSSVKITKRCSSTEHQNKCPGSLVFYAETMTFGVGNMVPHTCRSGVPRTQPSDASDCVDLMEEMKAFVDGLIEEDMAAKAIWAAIYTKFYSASTRVVRGLLHKQVLNLSPTPEHHPLLESPVLVKVKNDLVGFQQFHYTWHDGNKAKTENSGIGRLIGWSHPEIRNLLRYDGVHLFVDDTFRCVPKTYHQFVTLMVYDPLTDLVLPIFFTLVTNKTEGLYVKVLKRIEFVLGKQPNSVDVVCDFEAALINAIQDQYPSTRLIGCLFHFKQACSRKMKENALPDGEVGVAMAFGVFDMLTVIQPGKIVGQGVAWVKVKIKSRLDAKDLPYSRNQWKTFWRYFFRTWVDMYPPDLWNIYGVQRQIVKIEPKIL